MDKQEEILSEAFLDKYKYLILLIGIPLLIGFIRSLVIDLLVKDARRIGQQAQATDDQLSEREKAARDAANSFMQKVNEHLAQKPVDENWNNG